ncbi:MAG: nucleoside phosphorylase [Desulfobacteraceae bacterium]|nr:nucleoside phosphorylase [Desulfobacteraceae bacterium]
MSIPITCNDAIINPAKGRKSPDIGPVAVMVSSESDLYPLRSLMNLPEDNFKKLMMSRVYVGDESNAGISLTGPVISAPYAVMLLESLIAWGAQKIIYFGWCGSISHDIRIGDIIVPTGAIIDEGTSKHYCADEKEITKPSQVIVEKTKHALKQNSLPFHEGTIWTMDAIYRETREKVEYYQSENVSGVEMELSALFTVGKFRNAELGGILVVSDELASFTWQPGFSNEQFIQARAGVAEVIASMALGS